MPSTILPRRAAVCLALAVLLALAMVAGAGTVAAQDDAANATDGDDEPSEVLLDLDGEIRVTGAEWDDTAKVTLHHNGDFPKSVSIVDISPIDSAGGHQVDAESVRLMPGETVTVEVALADPDNPQLSLSTEEGVGLLVGDGGTASPYEGEEASWSLVQLAVGGAALGGALAIGLVGWSAVADRHDSTELVDP